MVEASSFGVWRRSEHARAKLESGTLGMGARHESFACYNINTTENLVLFIAAATPHKACQPVQQDNPGRVPIILAAASLHAAKCARTGLISIIHRGVGKHTMQSQARNSVLVVHLHLHLHITSPTTLSLCTRAAA